MNIRVFWWTTTTLLLALPNLSCKGNNPYEDWESNCPDGTKARTDKSADPLGGVAYCIDDDGTLNGPFVSWYESGKKHWEGEYIDGEMHGKWNWWYESGEKWEERQYVEGKNHGTWTEWDDDGRVKSGGQWRDGKPCGDHTCYDPFKESHTPCTDLRSFGCTMTATGANCPRCSDTPKSDGEEDDSKTSGHETEIHNPEAEIPEAEAPEAPGPPIDDSAQQ